MPDAHTSPSQEALILAALKTGARLTPLAALAQFGCARLGARIFQLRKDGHKILSRLVSVETAAGHTARVAEYRLDPASLTP